MKPIITIALILAATTGASAWCNTYDACQAERRQEDRFYAIERQQQQFKWQQDQQEVDRLFERRPTYRLDGDY